MDLASAGALLGSLAAVIVAVAGLLRNRDDNRRGDKTHSLDRLTSMSEVHSRILDDVEEHQVSPLRREVASLRDRLDAVQAESRSWRGRYWVSLDYNHVLRRALVRVAPDRADAIPPVPALIRDDLRERE